MSLWCLCCLILALFKAGLICLAVSFGLVIVCVLV